MISTPSWFIQVPTTRFVEMASAIANLKNLDFHKLADKKAVRITAKIAGFSLDDVGDSELTLEAMVRAGAREELLLAELCIERQNRPHN